MHVFALTRFDDVGNFPYLKGKQSFPPTNVIDGPRGSRCGVRLFHPIRNPPGSRVELSAHLQARKLIKVDTLEGKRFKLPF